MSVQGVEECLALTGQLNYIAKETATSQQTKPMIERFKQDILSGVFGENGHAYAQGFRAAQAAFRQDFAELDFSLLGLLCELALDPPLPFEREGVASTADWSSFHPARRFRRLLSAATQLDWLRRRPVGEQDARSIGETAADLLGEAGLERADSPSLKTWLGSYDEDTTEWPSQELAWQHTQMSIDGRQMVDTYPGLLFDFARCSRHAASTPFLDLPYVVINGRTHVLERGSEPAYRDAGRQIFNAHVARATDHLAFGKGKLDIVGLPTHIDDGFSIFAELLHEFFSAAWSVDLPSLIVER